MQQMDCFLFGMYMCAGWKCTIKYNYIWIANCDVDHHLCIGKKNTSECFFLNTQSTTSGTARRCPIQGVSMHYFLVGTLRYSFSTIHGSLEVCSFGCYNYLAQVFFSYLYLKIWTLPLTLEGLSSIFNPFLKYVLWMYHMRNIPKFLNLFYSIYYLFRMVPIGANALSQPSFNPVWKGGNAENLCRYGGSGIKGYYKLPGWCSRTRIIDWRQRQPWYRITWIWRAA